MDSPASAGLSYPRLSFRSDVYKPGTTPQAVSFVIVLNFFLSCVLLFSAFISPKFRLCSQQIRDFLYFLPPGDSIGSIYGSKNHELERKNINTRQRKTNCIVSMDGLEIGKLLEQDNKKSDLITDRYFERWSG